MNTLEPYGHSLERRPPEKWRRRLGRMLAWSPGVAAAATLAMRIGMEFVPSESMGPHTTPANAPMVVLGVLACGLSLPVSIVGLIVIPPKRRTSEWILWFAGWLAALAVPMLILAEVGERNGS